MVRGAEATSQRTGGQPGGIATRSLAVSTGGAPTIAAVGSSSPSGATPSGPRSRTVRGAARVWRAPLLVAGAMIVAIGLCALVFLDRSSTPARTSPQSVVDAFAVDFHSGDWPDLCALVAPDQRAGCATVGTDSEAALMIQGTRVKGLTLGAVVTDGRSATDAWSVTLCPVRDQSTDLCRSEQSSQVGGRPLQLAELDGSWYLTALDADLGNLRGPTGETAQAKCAAEARALETAVTVAKAANPAERVPSSSSWQGALLTGEFVTSTGESALLNGGPLLQWWPSGPDFTMSVSVGDATTTGDATPEHDGDVIVTGPGGTTYDATVHPATACKDV